MTDSQVEALFAINNLQAKQQSKSKKPKKILIVALSLVVFAILVSYFIGSFKPSSSSPSSSSGGKLGLPQQSSPTSENSATNQVNQDVKACSNPVNAVTVC
jgi:flagellar basal body-associated protein FliL